MYWRLLAAILLLVGASYFLGKRSAGSTDTPAMQVAQGGVSSIKPADNTGKQIELPEIAFAPAKAEPEVPVEAPQVNADQTASNASTPPPPVTGLSLDLENEMRRIGAAAGVSVGAIQVSDRLPVLSPMAMTFRRGSCVLMLNNRLPLNGFVLNNLSVYGQHQMTFTLGHEMGHCYVLTQVAHRNPSILASLSPPGQSYSFEQFVQMSGNYNEYPDLNRWNEEWADTFSAYIMAQVYGREFASNVTSERFALRKDQEKNGSVMTSNVYGGHASLADASVFSIQSPLEIANLVKIGRLSGAR